MSTVWMVESPCSFVSSQTWTEWTPRPDCLFHRVDMGTADIKAAPEEMLRDEGHSQAWSPLTDHIEKDGSHVEKVMP